MSAKEEENKVSVPEKVRLTINGKEVWARPGMPLLQAALDADIHIPHFCFHPGLGVDGNCRLCIVEIAGMPKLQTSCTIPVKEGLVVQTNSPPVQKARKGVLEFFLLNHPLDCPFCDKGGECPLQNYTYDSGQFSSRFKFEKVHKPKHQIIGEHIVLDKERCVLCNRCVRFGRNFAGVEELQIRQRGSKSEIFVPEGTQLTSGFTGNLADICPVGALTTREFRFRARPWEMKTINTVCGECSLGCNAQAWRKDNELLRLTPRMAPDVNEWWLCDRGRFSIHSIPENNRLVRSTHLGTDAGTPDVAARAMAAELKKLPPRSVAVVLDGTQTNEEFLRLKALANLAGHGRVFVPVTAETLAVKKRIASEGLEAEFPATLEQSKTVLILGERVEEDHPVLALRLRRLFYTQQLQIVSAGAGMVGLSDVSKGHLVVSKEKISEFFEALAKVERGGRLTWDGNIAAAAAALSDSEPLHVFLSDRWIGPETGMAIENWLEAAAKSKSPRMKVSVLLSGPNAHGFIDQWDDSIEPRVELETEIQRGRVEGLIWLGPAPSTEVFGEYAKGMRIFAHAVLTAKDAHPAARWVLSLDTFTEKAGTFTNTFGRVQTVRKARRVIEKGFAPIDFFGTVLSALGRPKEADVAQIYREVARRVSGYPHSMDEIPEATRTYHHYERAVWR